MTLIIAALSMRKYKGKQDKNRVTSYESATRARCITLPTNAGPQGLTPCNKATTTMVAMRSAKARNMTTTDTMIGAITRRVPKSTGRIPKSTATGGIPKSVIQGRVSKSTTKDSSPAACTVSDPTIPTRNVAKIRAIKPNQNCV